ncbi:small subunit ribosomal protein S1 [Dethiosulfatibacter aminovorans DSM 17477]|uniref:Small subunit ribosomal protein S1 n=1 Tax=Dethiosulfatibacter aminovorans DSM 17477 TaxID=1121476 RepID=A0A1M6DBA6_9FIRM|nr:S1 RNA-binding domain-containing protein [Dethiosulfatibacter aminovorans]SHI70532.1 small subunit ribosomal protein S1 [Dethiosulfatibacter aminovorans DSM 17477]
MSEKNEMQELLENFEFVKIYPGKKIKGTVILVNPDSALVNFGYKSDGIIEKENYTLEKVEDLSTILNVGDEIEAVVVSSTSDDGNVVLSRRQFEQESKWNEVVELFEKGEKIEITVGKTNEKGAIANFKGFSGFIPRSHLSKDRNVEPADFAGKTMEVEIIEAKMKNGKNKLIFSRKKIELDEARKVEQAAWEALEIKETYEGKVNRLADFGAFVEINGIEGLLHINEISWNRIKHPSDVLSIGDLVQVKVLKKDVEKRRMSLSLKANLQKPFEIFDENNKVDDIVTGKIVSLTNFGAFVQVENVQGLLHVSDISWDKVNLPEDVLNVGDEIQVKILKIDVKNERLSLGMKQLSEDPFAKYTKDKKRFDIVSGTVKSMTVEGAVIQLDDEIDGFVPLNKVSKDKLRTPAQVLEKDQEVECKIIDINRKNKTIKLSMIIETEAETKEKTSSKDVVSYTLGDDSFTIGDLFKKKD